MEEFVYQFQKMITEFQKSQPEFPPSTQYFILDSMFRQIDAASLSTAVVKGRENKAVFDDCVSKGKTLYRQLTKHPEVAQAIRWAEGERKKQLSLQQQKAGEEQKRREEVQDIGRQIERLEASRKKLTLMEWFKNRFGKQPVPVQIAMWVFYGFIWIPLFYKFSVASNEAALNEVADKKIEKLEERLAILQAAL